MVDFGGWHMPLQYTRIIPEHMCVREKVGLFDVSHMGEVLVRGEKALEVVRHLMTNNIRIEIGQAQYTPMCNDKGGIIDDCVVYRRSETEIMICINAANREKDIAWITSRNPHPDVEIYNASDDFAQLAIQGRHAQALIQKITDIPLQDIAYYHFAEGRVAGVDGCIVARTGYTGEDGFEIFLPATQAAVMWPAIRTAGEEFGLQCIGLGARDSLRLEARMHLYGSDMTEQDTPYDAGLGWAVKLKKDDFIGKEALLEYKNNHWNRRMVGLKVDKRIPRPGCDVLHDGKVVGRVTSGTKSPMLGYGIAMAYVDRSLARAGTSFEIDVRGKRAPAVSIKGSFYTLNY